MYIKLCVLYLYVYILNSDSFVLFNPTSTMYCHEYIETPTISHSCGGISHISRPKLVFWIPFRLVTHRFSEQILTEMLNNIKTHVGEEKFAGFVKSSR